MAEPSEVNGEVLPSGPQAAATTGLGNGISAHHEFLDKVREPPITRLLKAGDTNRKMLLELQDGSTYQGYSFGASRSCGGELVFQTGMVGYPESVTDPSYRGQILVMTWPLAGNYGVPSRNTRDKLLEAVPAYFEAAKIHIAGLVVASYAGEDYSHHLASSSLGDWLRENDVPAVYGVDTRALTKRIRHKGSMLGRMLLGKGVTGAASGQRQLDIGMGKNVSTGQFEYVEWSDPNDRNLVIEVSCHEPQLYTPRAESALFHPSGRPIRVICVDVGLKFNQLRCLVSRGVEVLRVPFDYAFPKLAGKIFDGLFISNGPGNPALLTETVQNIETAIAENRTPIFGICLGHQLLARAAGASTLKMKFGNRGHNIPCTNKLSGRCYITSQNHGYAVDAMSLPADWEEIFVNANDKSNEGIRHKSRPIFSVQFHPESAPGPRDTEFLFDVFIDAVKRSVQDASTLLRPLNFPGGSAEENEALHPRVNVKKVLVIGSGGLSIGQAGEFDYSGSQAIKALKEEGIYTVLINPNIATIQTSKGLADKVYFLPVNADSVRKVIKHERPDGIFVTFGGQTALQIGVELENEFESLGVTVLGTPIETIKLTEDRELFSQRMATIDAPCAPGITATSLEEAVQAAETIRYPVIVRAAYALGGLGSGFAENKAQLQTLCEKAFTASPQVLVERSMKGWKEIEYEVVRDAQDNCITVCNMENFDPLGIHTGDSIVVAPSQTLSDEDYQMLRSTAIRVIRNLGVIGECNIQYGLNPDSNEFAIIEVNARLSRSSALASKATGYPLAFVAAKLGLGIPLNEISNSVTKVTCACFEPSLDYVVVKIPRWDLKKFTRASKTLGSAMKSVGEVMAIGRTFEEAIQKGIRGVDHHNDGFNATEALISIDIDTELQTPSDQRLFAIANAFYQGYTIDEVFRMTKIDRWFLQRLKGLSDFSIYLSQFTLHSASTELLRQSKKLGFSDRQLRKLFDSNELEVRRRRVEAGITPVVKQIDTVAAEFPAVTNYLYLTYNGSEHDIGFNDHGIIVLGSGVYRIGSSVEFDWCSVTTIRTLRENGCRTITINNNPETVSTDFDEADKLYFENITLETVLDIYQLEKSSGLILSMGGQTPNNIALPLYRAGVHILGTSPESIDRAENRFKWSRLLDQILVDQPAWKELTNFDEAAKFCEKVAYPVLVRPSYVLSGAAMNIVYSRHDLERYLQEASDVSPQHPVVITKYIQNAKEIEVDAVALNGKVIGHFISEHVENAGVHSGDATLVHPPQDLDPETVRRIENATQQIGGSLNITGPFNIQFIAKDNEIKVIECNVRASRSFPFVSKVTGVNLIEMATKAMMGLPVTEYPSVSIPKDYVGVKVPQFSFSRLSGADPVSGVEMASTGEVACFGRDKYEAYIKALIATGFKLPKRTVLLSLGSHRDKIELLPSIRKLYQLGYHLFTTPGTHDFLESNGVSSQYLDDVPGSSRPEYSLSEYMSNKEIDMYINLPSNNHFRRPANFLSAGYKSRRQAIDRSIPLVTNIKNAKILVEALSRRFDLNILEIDSKTYETSIKLATQSLEAPPKPLEPASTVHSRILELLSRSPQFKDQDILSVDQVNRESLHSLFTVAQEMRLGVEKHGILEILKGKVLCTLFYEPSTRTSASFDAAMQRLGGGTVPIATSFSSTVKGESLADTVRTLACYGDAIALRHPLPESAAIAAEASPVPVLNCGNGSLEHPTQAFLDLFTIREELGTVNGLTLTFIGDLRWGRTVHSCLKLLAHYNVNIQLVAPTALALPADIRESLVSRGQLLAESTELDPKIVARSDVLYCTRVQKERFDNPAEYEELKDKLIVDNAVLSHAKTKMIVMHPLPRNKEIPEEVDLDQRAAYFRQMRHGLFIRMALLALVLY